MSATTRILLTGATTPIGRGLVRALLDDPAIEHVIAVGREPEGEVDLPLGPRLSYERFDLRRSRDRRRLLFGPARERGVTALVHTALHRRAQDTGRRVHDLNVEATRELLHLAERHPTIERFIFRSSASVYRIVRDKPSVIDEEHPLNLDPKAPQWIRDRVEADLTVCTYMGVSSLKILVLRCAECLAPDAGSQLYDYLQAPICLRPLGFDPMINLMSLGDAVGSLKLALACECVGTFNIPGADTLPLSRMIAAAGRRAAPMPEPLLGPAYRLRTAVLGTDFRYDLNTWRFHFSGVLDGRRAAAVLGYRPTQPIDWPLPPSGA
ncbi:MAG: NAD-dependent epimerase/dehydratase family protein [Myxococcales bacterium]|nr:NAD-dependent epimerase/dehydratase family protein [Myxococcales bacterium]